MGKNFSMNTGTVEGFRRDSDMYETPYSILEQLLDVEDLEEPILEPACGNGAMLKVIEEFGYIDVEGYDKETDFLKETRIGKFATICTNPPYRLAKEFILKAKEVARTDIYMLLPLSYLHGVERYHTIFQDTRFPLKQVFIFTRYPMLGDPIRDDGKYRTGMMVYAWYHWQKSYKGIPGIRWINNQQYILSKKDA